MTDIQKLKALAEAATPSKWSTSGSYIAPTRQENGCTFVESWCSIALVHADNDRAFIAAANPAAVLELIAEIERLRDHKQALIALRKTHGFDSWAAALVQIDVLRKALTTIREESHDLGACECAADALADSKKPTV